MNDKNDAFKLYEMSSMVSLPLYETILISDDELYDQFVFETIKDQKNIEIDKNTKMKSKTNRFRYGILLASDVIAVGIDNISKENWKVGLTAGY